MTTLKTILRRARTLLWTAFSILVILAAIAVGVGKLLMPYSEHYQHRLEAWLSEEFGRPVRLQSFEGEWRAFGPRLSLRGMTLLPPEDGAPDSGPPAESEVAIQAADLDVRPLNLLIPGKPLYSFRIVGADFELVHTPEGQLKLSGMGVTGRGGQGSALRELSRVGEVTLQNSSLDYIDERNGMKLELADIQGRLDMRDEKFSAQIEASLFDGRSKLIYGDIEATVALAMGSGQKIEKAQWQATARELMLAAFQGRLPENPFLPLAGWLNAELWGNWSESAGHRIRGAADLKQARLVNAHQDLRLDRLNARFAWEFRATRSWSLDLADLLYDDGTQRWRAPRVSLARDTADDLGLWISADRLPLGVPLNLARDIMSLYETPWPASLPGQAVGQVSDLDLVLAADWKLKFASGSVREASVFEWGRWPDLRGLDGELALADGEGSIELRSEALEVSWPRMFREPLTFRLPECRLDMNWGAQWQFAFEPCELRNEDLSAGGRLLFRRNEGKPAVDINVVAERGEVGKLAAYLPEALLRPKTLSWLRRSLKDGKISAGRFQIRGDMDDWPFGDGTGRFEALGRVEDGRLDFLDEWPDATGVDAAIHFAGTGMAIDGRVDDIGGAPLDAASARIGNLREPVLELRYSSSTSLPQLLTFLQHTPLQKEIRLDLEEYRFEGSAGVDGALSAPLKGQAKGLEVDGQVRISEGRFEHPASDVILTGLTGSLRYDEAGLQGTSLDAVYRGYRARLDVAAGRGRSESFRADLTGVFGVRDLLPDSLYGAYPALARLSGAAACNLSVVVESAGGAERSVPILNVESMLYGVEVDLPEPLGKRGDEGWPMTLRLPLAGADRVLDLRVTDLASLRYRLPGEGTSSRPAATVRLGPGPLPELVPGKIGLEGEAGSLDLDGWIDVILEDVSSQSDAPRLEFDRGDVDVKSLKFMDRVFDDVEMKFRVEEEVTATFGAEDIHGTVRLTLADGGMRSLAAEFDRLALGEPVSAGVEMDPDPSRLPALHLYARSFRYIGMELGETRIEAYPIAEGFHFEKVDASSDQLSIQARGNWLLDEAGQRSDFSIHMTSESLGDFLQSMDISSSMEGGQTVVDFNAWWPGSPAAFALARLNGRVDFSVVDGNISNASAGSGRLLGLLSVQALPKRLALDFRDVFDSGFSFDEATGTFDMRNGKARTEDVILTSSSATISISGTTDLVERQYDQLLTIRPGVGNTLPIIGALAAGPGGAAAGLALQGLFHNQLGEATKVRYRITGDWEDPVFEPVEVEIPVAEPAAAAAANDTKALTFNEDGE